MTKKRIEKLFQNEQKQLKKGKQIEKGQKTETTNRKKNSKFVEKIAKIEESRKRIAKNLGLRRQKQVQNDLTTFKKMPKKKKKMAKFKFGQMGKNR